MSEYKPKKVSIWLSAESQRVIGDRNRSGTINAMIERVGAVAEIEPVAGCESDIDVHRALKCYRALPKKINGKANPDARKTVAEFADELMISWSDAIILLEQIESGKL